MLGDLSHAAVVDCKGSILALMRSAVQSPPGLGGKWLACYGSGSKCQTAVHWPWHWCLQEPGSRLGSPSAAARLPRRVTADEAAQRSHARAASPSTGLEATTLTPRGRGLADLSTLCYSVDPTRSGYIKRILLEKFLARECRALIQCLPAVTLLDLLQANTYGSCALSIQVPSARSANRASTEGLPLGSLGATQSRSALSSSSMLTRRSSGDSLQAAPATSSCTVLCFSACKTSSSTYAARTSRCQRRL